MVVTRTCRKPRKAISQISILAAGLLAVVPWHATVMLQTRKRKSQIMVLGGHGVGRVVSGRGLGERGGEAWGSSSLNLNSKWVIFVFVFWIVVKSVGV